MRLLFFLFFILAILSHSNAVIVSDTVLKQKDTILKVNGILSKRAFFDVPGEIQPEGVTGNPKFVKQTKG
ncbi:hypothetical protein CAEBREN_06880 [Caenorhabditis brenneri]|uniref:Uncharacterized protein n=1 Tax=Caenorhabditis brenneri TaxID=135651 RepID=G0P6N5_CAEBE|nr:hypothetical protein CAEBREN_06880 [Caenorhabditis brenneri]